ESARPQVIAPPAPDVLDRPRPAERSESVVAGHSVLAHEEAQARHGGDMRHRLICSVEGEPSQTRKVYEMRQARGGHGEVAVVQVKRKETIESGQIRHAPIG